MLLKQVWSDGRQRRGKRKYGRGDAALSKKDYAGFNISKTRVTGSPQLINSTKSDAEQCARYANYSPTTPPPIC
jgi:hypothetical protein